MAVRAGWHRRAQYAAVSAGRGGPVAAARDWLFDHLIGDGEAVSVAAK